MLFKIVPGILKPTCIYLLEFEGGSLENHLFLCVSFFWPHWQWSVLTLALSSAITPSGAQESLCGVKNPTHISCMEGKCLNACVISLDP